MQRKLDLTITLDITTTRQPQGLHLNSTGRLEKQFQHVYTFLLSAVLLQTFVETIANTRLHRLKNDNT